MKVTCALQMETISWKGQNELIYHSSFTVQSLHPFLTQKHSAALKTRYLKKYKVLNWKVEVSAVAVNLRPKEGNIPLSGGQKLIKTYVNSKSSYPAC